MTIYNLLFKGIEKRTTPWCKAFSTKEEAQSYIDADILSSGLTAKSIDRNDEDTISDVRCEDTHGNSYYYVLFTQEITS